MRFWARVGAASVLILTAALVAPVAQQAARAEDPIFVDWTSLLPGLTDTYDPSSENVCVAGKPQCIDAVIKEMKRRFEPLGRSCHHNAIFSLAYLRTTQTFKWASDQPGYFNEAPWVNHEAAVFAKYYFTAYDNWAAGRRDQTPQAWVIAFDAAAGRRVTGSGDLMLGMSAHINRDLPLTLAAIGIATPDGETRKPDHDKVDQFLNTVTQPVLAEAAARFDPDVATISTPYGVGYTALFQQVQAWRERAWRYAELLTEAPTAQARALIVQEIETNAAAEALSIVATFSYLPPVRTTSSRDAYCATHNASAPPMSYAFGTPTAY
jgi:hypothetical protein